MLQRSATDFYCRNTFESVWDWQGGKHTYIILYAVLTLRLSPASADLRWSSTSALTNKASQDIYVSESHNLQAGKDTPSLLGNFPLRTEDSRNSRTNEQELAKCGWDWLLATDSDRLCGIPPYSNSYTHGKPVENTEC